MEPTPIDYAVSLLISTPFGSINEQIWTLIPNVCIIKRMALLTFETIANLTIIQQFYYLAWRLFGVNIALISPDLKQFQSMGSTSWSSFCVKLRQMGFETNCLDCDRKHAAIVGNQKHPLRYRCWAGLREFIVPIMLNNEVLAYIQCGQVLDEPPNDESWAAICKILMAGGVHTTPPKDTFFAMRSVSPQTQQDLMALLELFGNYIAYAQHQILLAEARQKSTMEELALAYILDHYTEPITLDDIAKAAVTSKRSLTRNFREQTGKTVLESIQEMRISQACTLLRAGEMKCAEIAYEVGFGSVQQFNRVFYKLHHCTPHTWSKREKENDPQVPLNSPN
jgi:AraC-like DNA-binding protein